MNTNGLRQIRESSEKSYNFIMIDDSFGWYWKIKIRTHQHEITHELMNLQAVSRSEVQVKCSLLLKLNITRDVMSPRNLISITSRQSDEYPHKLSPRPLTSTILQLIPRPGVDGEYNERHVF